MHSALAKSKLFVVFSVLALVSLALSACGGATTGGKMKTSIGAGEGEVSIIS